MSCDQERVAGAERVAAALSLAMPRCGASWAETQEASATVLLSCQPGALTVPDYRTVSSQAP